MKPKSKAARYLEEECPALLTGTSYERAHALTSWAERHRGQSRVGIYKRIAMALALTLVFRSDRDFIVALSSKPVPLGQIWEKRSVRMFLAALNNYGPVLDRSQQKRLSRDVRAVCYLLINETPPDGVFDLAMRKGEGVHTWAADYAREQEEEDYDLDAVGKDDPRRVLEPQKVEIAIKIGKGKRQYFECKMEFEEIDLLGQFIEKMIKKSEKNRTE